MNPTLICDNCGSDKITDTITSTPTKNEPPATKMSEYKGPSFVTTLEHRLINHKLTCGQCGFSVNYSN